MWAKLRPAAAQAMAAAAQKLVREKWAAKRATDVYADYNALTLDIVTEVLFGWDIPKAQADTIVGETLLA